MMKLISKFRVYKIKYFEANYMQVTSSSVQMSQVSGRTANQQSANSDQCQCFGRTVSRPSSTALFLAAGLTVSLSVGLPVSAVTGSVAGGFFAGLFTGVIGGALVCSITKCLYMDYHNIVPKNPTPPPTPIFGWPQGIDPYEVLT